MALNERTRTDVLTFVRVGLHLFLVVMAWAMVACSGSRMMDAEVVMTPGDHVRGTVSGSDVMVGEGSFFKVAYSFQNRFYVSAGGGLTGFQRGSRNTTIYAEKGARLPEARFLGGARVVTVASAQKAYQDRFNELPPLKSRAGQIGSSGSNDDSEECDDYYHRSERPVSVTPESYQRKD